MTKKIQVNDRKLERIEALMEEVIRKASRREGQCLYRGEPECYPIVSSGLYRKCPNCEDEAFDIDRLEREIVERARQYTTLAGKDEILAEVQHFGGATNLLDFTNDYLIALFFASAERDGKDGRVVLHWPNPDALIWPKHTNNRVVFQKSVFVRPRRGFIVPDSIEETVVVPDGLKGSILTFLERFHGISEKSVFNDIHGYIRHQDLRRSRYAGEFREILSKSRRDPSFDLGCHLSTQLKRVELVRMRHYSHQKGMDYVDGRRSEFAIRTASGTGPATPCFLELEPDEVVDLLTHCIRERDGSVQLKNAYCWRGATHCFQGKHDLALSDFEKALDLDAELPGAYHGRASIYRQRGNLDLAMKDLEKALNLEPHLPAALIDRGNLQRDSGALEHAIRDFSAAMARSRSGSKYTWFRDGHFYRAVARCIKKDWSGAESDLGTARREGLRVASSFRNIFGGASKFEADYDLRLPSIVTTMLYVG